MKKCHFELEKECPILNREAIMCVACQMHSRNVMEQQANILQERLITTQEALTKAVTPEAYQNKPQTGGTGYK